MIFSVSTLASLKVLPTEILFYFFLDFKTLSFKNINQLLHFPVQNSSMNTHSTLDKVTQFPPWLTNPYRVWLGYLADHSFCHCLPCFLSSSISFPGHYQEQSSLRPPPPWLPSPETPLDIHTTIHKMLPSIHPDTNSDVIFSDLTWLPYLPS